MQDLSLQCPTAVTSAGCEPAGAGLHPQAEEAAVLLSAQAALHAADQGTDGEAPCHAACTGQGGAAGTGALSGAPACAWEEHAAVVQRPFMQLIRDREAQQAQVQASMLSRHSAVDQ